MGSVAGDPVFEGTDHTTSAQLESVVSFVIGASTRLAVASHWVAEVADATRFSVMPRAPEHVVGIAQIRARPIPVVDLGLFFGLKGSIAGRDGDGLRYVVAGVDEMEVALVGRSVLVQNVGRADIEQDEMDYGQRLRPYVRGAIETSRGIAVLLDLPAALEATRVRE